MEAAYEKYMSGSIAAVDELQETLTEEQWEELNAYIEQKKAEQAQQPVVPETPVVPEEFDVEAAYETLMACESEEEIEAFLSSLSEEELEALQEYVDNQPCVVDENPVTVPFTEASPFLPPVYVPYVAQQRVAMRSNTRSTFARTNSGNTVSTYASDNSSADGYGSSDGLGMKKTARVIDVTTGETQITLEAFTTGTVKTSSKTTPCDIVFVIDQSGSMAWGMAGQNSVISDSNPERMATTKKVMRTFLEEVVDNATDSNGNVLAHHRVAVIGFSSDGYSNNELLTGVTISNKNGAQYGSITTDEYAAALQDVTTENGKQNVLDAIDALSTSGGTQPVYGFNMAHEVFGNDPGVQGETSRQRVVVFLTDGEPDNIDATGYGHQVAEEAVAAAYPLKNTDGATVYTIGMFEGANADYIGATGTAMANVSKANRANRFMNLASSNYPSANEFYLSITTVLGVQLRWLADVPDRAEGNYYLVANDESKLSEIFQTIQESVSSATIELGADTVIKDVISDYFELPVAATNGDISLYTVECTGMSSGEFVFDDDNWVVANGANATISSDRKNVEVTGFNFNDNFVTADAKPGTANDYGRKLVIVFTVTPKDGFWGGNSVPTNGTDSGVYDKDGTLVENFTVPTVDVPIQVPDFEGNTVNVYFNGDQPDKSDFYDAIPFPDDWRTEYVNQPTYELDRTVDTTADGATYTVTATVTPKTGSGSGTNNAQATVHVFTPNAKFKDSVIYYTETANYSNNAPTQSEIIWKRGDEVAGTVSVPMSNQTPEVAYDYDKEADAFTDCTEVTPTLSVKNKECGSANKFTVHVLIPTITWADTDCYYGEYIPGSFNASNVSWACSDGVTTSATAPALSYKFDASGVMQNKDKDVNVTKVSTSAGEIPMGKVTFQFGSDKHAGTAAEKEFTIHPLTCTLTITKAGWNEELDPHQSFIFNFERTDGNAVTEKIGGRVTVQGNDTVAINGLPTGTYKVTEETGWSWRYQQNSITDTDNKDFVASKDHDAVKVKVSNTRVHEKWLDGNAYVVNTWTENGINDQKKSSRRRNAQ